MQCYSRETMSEVRTLDEQDNCKTMSDREDEFQSDQVSLDEEWSLTEGEEDLQATVETIKDREQASSASATSGKDASSRSKQPETIDTFLRNFLAQMGMAKTLDCFQIEWMEMVQKGQVVTEKVTMVPDIYCQIQRLETELKNARLEREEYQLAASFAADTLERVRRARDNRRLKHSLVIQEKNKLVEEARKLKDQCKSYEPCMKRLEERYQAVLRQTMRVVLARDRVSGPESHQDMQHIIAPPPSHVWEQSPLTPTQTSKELCQDVENENFT